LGVGRALAATDEQRSVPLLLGEDVGKGEAEYQRILDAMVINASMKQDGFDRLESLEEPGGGGRGDDESVYSITSQMSTISVASSTRMTAGQRRRWHKQQQMQSMKAAGRSKSQMNPAMMLSPHPEIPSSSSQVTGMTAMSTVAGRQQSLVGSHPYLCEVFHDSYGIGPEPARGLVDCSGFSSRCSREGGTEFYPPSSHVTDLLVFNTTRSSYGLAKSAASVAAASAQSKSAKGTREEQGGRPGAGAGISNSPVSVARKSQSSGGGNGINKPSLANLVFKADATEANVAGPSLDLPATLPHELAA